MIVVTSDTVPRHHVHQVLGEVIGVAVCTRNPFDAGMKSSDGEPVNRMAALAERRGEAVANLGRAAAQLGANAVVAMRFDHRDAVTGAWSEICAYGTAVVVVEDPQPCPCSSADRAAVS